MVDSGPVVQKKPRRGGAKAWNERTVALSEARRDPANGNPLGNPPGVNTQMSAIAIIWVDMRAEDSRYEAAPSSLTPLPCGGPGGLHRTQFKKNQRFCSAIAGCRKRRVCCAGCSGDLLPPPPPREQATACQDQAGQASADDGARGEKLRALISCAPFDYGGNPRADITFKNFRAK